MLLNVGCGTHYADGWVNVDVYESDTTRPDVVVDQGDPLPFDRDAAAAVYLGHVLEHMPWLEVPHVLGEVLRVGEPGAPVLVVGPDVFRTIRRWADGVEPWHMVESTLEHQDVNFQPGREHEWWYGAAHFWNCHHDRLWRLLDAMGFVELADVADLIPDDPDGRWWDDPVGVRWPVVGKNGWQCAIRCRVPQGFSA